MTQIYPVILSGGGGLRLWPVSTPQAPKQFHSFISEHSMLENTMARFLGDENFAPPILISNLLQEEKTNALLRDGKHGLSLHILEPMARNTAFAAALAALWLEEIVPGSLMLVAPSDHWFADSRELLQKIGAGRVAAKGGHLGCFGIKPRSPATGYGYLRRGKPASKFGKGIYTLRSFHEKPDLKKAQSYLNDSKYWWNSGLFLFSPRLYLSELKKYAPAIEEAARLAFNQGKISNGPDGWPILSPNPTHVETCPNLSLDVAVMEKTKYAAAIPLESEWSDLGDWKSVYDETSKDQNGNTISGNVIQSGSNHCYLYTQQSRPLLAVGLQNITVIDHKDGVLVADMSKSQSVKDAVETLRGKEDSATVSFAQSPTGTTRRQLDQEFWRQKYRQWLTGHALPLWSEKGVRQDTGATVEALDFSGNPVAGLPIRTRVLARQIFSFACAYEKLGWQQGAKSMLGPLQFLLNFGRDPHGNWVHLLGEEGEIIDGKIDSYDYAFILLALAWAYRVTGETDLQIIAHETLDSLRLCLGDQEQQGFKEDNFGSQPRRANPHMHIFEAALAWMELHQDERFAQLAAEIVNLFQTRFCVNGLLREYFNEDWTLYSGEATPNFVEPGHLYEWSYLLKEYAAILDKPVINFAPMLAFAFQYGFNPHTRFVANYCSPEGVIASKSYSRVWAQTEFIRYGICYGNQEMRIRAVKHLDIFFRNYLTIDGKSEGLWHEKISYDGNNIESRIPASSLYHIVGMIARL